MNDWKLNSNYSSSSNCEISEDVFTTSFDDTQLGSASSDCVPAAFDNVKTPIDGDRCEFSKRSNINTGPRKRACIPIVMVSDVVFPRKDNKFSIPNSVDNRRIAQYARKFTSGIIGCCTMDGKQAYRDFGTLVKLLEVTDEGVCFEPISGFEVMERGVKTYMEESSNQIGMINCAEVFIFPQENVSDALLHGEMTRIMDDVTAIAARNSDDVKDLRELMIEFPGVSYFTWMMGDQILEDSEGRYAFLKLNVAARFKALKLLVCQLSGDAATPMEKTSIRARL